MPRIVPPHLKPYTFHGVDVDWQDGATHATGTCPFCGKEGKFSININDGLWQCFVCREGTANGGGNSYTFIRRLWDLSDEATNGDIDAFARSRSLLDPMTLSHWGICKSILTRDWLVPGYGIDGKLNQLYRYVRDIKDGKSTLFPTPELHHQLHGIPLFDASKPYVILAEGPWDGMALWEVLRCSKRINKSLAMTANPDISLLSEFNVLAIPGCGSVGEPLKKWLPLLANKIVFLMFDSDHPRVHHRREFTTGFDAMKRAAQIMATADDLPKEVRFIKWGPAGYDASQKSGYDVRDALSAGARMTDRIAILDGLLKKVQPIPSEWVAGVKRSILRRGSVQMETLPCKDWKTLVNSWRKSMDWTEGLDRALSVMLACIASTKLVGDQLWCKILGPAASGKSTLCEAVSINRKYVRPYSTVRGFHSGYKEGKDDDGDDASLIAQLYNKTLVTKDGDTLLQSPNLAQTLSEARDMFDGTSRTHYRNKMGKDYEGLRVTWILCGTSSLHQLDSSELGERFLDCVIMHGIEDELEDRVIRRKLYQAMRNMSMESDGKAETQHDPDLVNSMRLTGGYIDHLCENAPALLAGVSVPDWAMDKMVHLAKFVAFMRARPSKKQIERAERELGTRLGSQIMRLAMCLTIALTRKAVDAEIMRRVQRVAWDTSEGRVLNMTKELYRAGVAGIEFKALANLTNETDDNGMTLLRFMRKIEAVETFVVETPGPGGTTIRSKVRWRLTERLRKLFKEVYENAVVESQTTTAE